MNGIRMPVAKTRTGTSGYGTTFRRITIDDLAGGDRVGGGTGRHAPDEFWLPGVDVRTRGRRSGVRNPMAQNSASSKLSSATISLAHRDAPRCRLDVMPLCSSCQR